MESLSCMHTITSQKGYFQIDDYDRHTSLSLSSSNPGLEGPCETISIVSAPCAVPVFWKRHKTEAPSQSPIGAGSLNLTLSFVTQ